MSEKLDFSIPTRGQKKNRSQSKLMPVLVIVVLIAVLANIGIVLMEQPGKNERQKGGELSAKQQKQLALKLEKQGLAMASAAAWKQYIHKASPDDEDTARIWYRIGKLYQTENRHDMALESFYRSESFAKPDDIAPEIARRVQECLEAMGKFAALRYELADRVGNRPFQDIEGSGVENDPVVAEIGAQKIRKSYLDRRIEYQIDRQLSQLAAYLPENQIKKKKEELLKQYSTDSQRRIFLNQYILEEVLYRMARESRLMDDAGVREALKDMERSILAGELIEKKFLEEIKITPGDLETYFEANRQEYVQPERARISHILVRNRQKVGEIRKRLAKGETFEDLASEMSMDGSTVKEGGEIAGWIEKKDFGSIPGIGSSGDAVGIIFSTPEGKVADDNIESERGIHIVKVLEHEKEHQKSFEEVKNEVYLALRAKKEREVQEKLFSSLKEQYDVVIHQSAFVSKNESEEASSE